MKLSIGLIVAVLLSLPAWGQGPYSMSYQPGGTDITGYLPTTNAWKLLPGNGGCNANTFVVPGDADIACIGFDNYIWTFANGVWTKSVSSGTASKMLAVGDASHVWGLQPTPYCTNLGAGWGVFNWTGTTWTQPNPNACLSQFMMTDDDLVLVGTNLQGQMFTSPDGVTYTQVSGASNLKFASAATALLLCATDGNAIYTGTGTISALPVQPASSGISGCIVTSEGDSIYAWGTFGVKRYDTTAGSWSVVTGLSGVTGMASYQKGTTFALSSSGQPYHLNVYAGAITGTITGSTSGCPTQPCNSQVYHDGYVLLELPHGHNTTPGTSHVLHNVNMNVSMMDWSEKCDPLFGDPQDPECIATDINPSVTCELSGFNFFSSQGGNPPPPPPSISEGKSVNGLGWDGTIHFSAAVPIPGGYYQLATCGLKNACATGTAPTCPTNIGQKIVDDSCHGSPSVCNSAYLQQLLTAGCKSRSAKQNGSWEIIEPYTQSGSEVLCTGLRAFFKGPGSVICQ